MKSALLLVLGVLTSLTLALPTTEITSTALLERHSAVTTTAFPSKIRGVNIGGWLVAERWLNDMAATDLWDGLDASLKDQWSLDSRISDDKLKNHWDTWFTEDDVKKIKSYGLNAMRIPIGYWAYDNSGTPFKKGADDYLAKAIDWARGNGLYVMIDLHGAPGSQNGFDNSGHEGAHDWQEGDNMDRTISVLKTIASKYATSDNAGVVFAIELVNEPISWDGVDFLKTQAWTKTAYAAVKSAASNQNLIVVIHNAFQPLSSWLTISATLNGASTPLSSAHFAIDIHPYQNFDQIDLDISQDAHIKKACSWSANMTAGTAGNLPVIVGEFGTATEICVYRDGHITPGNTCNVAGCQCQANTNSDFWSQGMIDAIRKYTEAQLDTFEKYAQAWFIWNYRAAGGWDLNVLVEKNVLPQPLNERKFPGQCGFTL